MSKFSSVLLSLILLSVGLCISSSSVFSIWVGMEMTVFLILALFSEKLGGIKSPSLEGIWKYFFIQSVASLWLVFSLVFFVSGKPFISQVENAVAFLILFINMGVFPFHSWSFHLVESLSWISLIVLSSLIKFPPLFLIFVLSWIGPEGSFLELASLVNCLISVGFMLKNLSIKWLILSSSNYLLSWLLVSASLSEKELVGFMTCYLVQSLLVFSVLDVIGNDGSGVLGLSTDNKLLTSLVVLGLMGVPPFPVFWGNLIVVFSICESGLGFLSVSLLFLSVVGFFGYLKLIVLTFLGKEGFVESLERFSARSVLWVLPLTVISGLFFLF